MWHYILKMKFKIVLFVGSLTLILMLFNITLEALIYLFQSPIKSQTDLEIIEEDIRNHQDNFKHPILLWWNPFSSKNELRTCQAKNKEYKCFFSHFRHLKKHPMTSAIFFYGTELSPVDLPLPRSLNEDWALLHEESPKNNPLLSQNSVITLFNHTATFRTESDLPLTLQYLESLDSITDERFLVPLSTKNRLIQKEDLGLVAYVQSSCDTPSGRDEYVSELMKHIKVDSYGHCLHNKDLPKHLREPQKMKDPDFLHILAQYKFVLAIENAVCPDYITEKLWKVLQVSDIQHK